MPKGRVAPGEQSPGATRPFRPPWTISARASRRTCEATRSRPCCRQSDQLSRLVNLTYATSGMGTVRDRAQEDCYLNQRLVENCHREAHADIPAPQLIPDEGAWPKLLSTPKNSTASGACGRRNTVGGIHHCRANGRDPKKRSCGTTLRLFPR